MRDYPPDAATRRQLREQARVDELARAEEAAARAGRSAKCGGIARFPEHPHHADEKGGCANDGSTCLCECHDRPSNQVPKQEDRPQRPS